MPDPDLAKRAIEYARLSRIAIDLETPLGHGTDGSVWRSDRASAVKVIDRQRNYHIELECYQRLSEAAVTRLHGFAVPKLLGWADNLQVVEIGIVSPPFIIDFAKAWLDSPPEFSEETWNDWHAEGQERFEDRWPVVLNLLSALKQYGIFYYDAKPANIMFGDEGRLP